MATEFRHRYIEYSADAIKKRVQNMLAFRDEVDVDNAHVKLSYDNRKTGANVPSVSLIPVADCGNCKVCSRGCYDVRNVCFQTTVQMSRANNSAILIADRIRYFKEVEDACKFLRFFRWHIGGDIKDDDYLRRMVGIAMRQMGCEFLAFTKMYDIVNGWLDIYGEFPKNLHIIFSDWRGAEFDNPYNLPVSSPLWPDGTKGPHCTDSFYMCGGDCTACAEVFGGCWSAGKGSTILFDAH